MKQNIKKSAIILTFIFVFLLFGTYGTTFASKIKDNSAPTAPANLTATKITTNSITLAWTASIDNIGVRSYYVYRNGVQIASINSTSYTNYKLLSDTSYSYMIRARDAAGNLSQPSSTLNVKTLSTITPSPTPTPTLAPTPTPIPTVTPIPTPLPTQTPMPASTKYVMGYYASWSAYSGFTPDKIMASNLTHINYAFAIIGTDNRIAMGDSTIDPSNFTKLSSLKNAYPNLKTLISIGGYNGSGKFSDVALTDASRNTFADSCVRFIKTYGFDGIDIDWEYPVSGGLSSNIKRPEDKQNFTLLLQVLRQKLDAQGSLDGTHYLLSFAGGAGSWYCNNVEMDKVSYYVDYAIAMTYDIHGPWDTYTDFNAPLYNPTETSPQYKWSVDSTVKAWQNAKFPANKLVIGVPFYGYVYTGVTNLNNGLYQTYSSGSSINYDAIVSKYLSNKSFILYNHSQAQVPWLWNGSTFVAYDDAASIGAKAAYVKQSALLGASAWQLGGDVNGVLLSALHNGLQ